ncbi:MAG TPA: selenium-binding family protein [Vicinamibacterales bacterium]
MATMRPDPTFYPSPRMAMQAPPERLAYVALLNVGNGGRKDALGVVDVDPGSPTYGQLVGRTDFPHGDNELHHFGWNACSACLCPQAPHPHVERRYLVVPGIGSSRFHILDTKPDPTSPSLVKVIEPEEFIAKTGYTAPHTIHCGPDGIYGSALGAANGDGPGGIFLLDAETFEVKGQWERDHGPQYLAYDFWWHLGHDTMITSEWGTPNMVKDGVNPELLLAGKYGHALHVWNLDTREHEQAIDLGPEQQMVLELRPAHDPRKAYGFVGVVLSLADLSSSIWMWYRDDGNGTWKVKKVIEIPAEPADPDQLPPLLEGFKAVPPLLSDINLSLDDRMLYASCWGTGEFIQFDVSDPANPKKVGSVRIGGIAWRTPHPSQPDRPLSGGPQMVELSRDGRRIYFTSSLYSPWDAQFYPEGLDSWMVRLEANPNGGLRFDEKFFVEFDGLRAHQVRLEGGDASSDSYCFPD